MDLLSARASLRAAARLRPRAFRGRPVGRAALGPVASSSTRRSGRASSRRAGFSSERSQRSQRSDSERSERSSRKTENDADTSDTSVRAYVRRVPFVDLYAVLAVDPAASTAQINASWKRLQKAVHPDVAGAYAETAAALLNEARAVLVRPIDRDAHDSDRAEWLKRGGTDRDLFSVFATEPLSAWSGPSGRESASSRSSSSFSFEEFGGGPVANDSEKSPNRQSSIDVSRGVFVDESQCIGCVQCATTAPNTFRVETRFGRARVVDQWADGADAVADAVETCPVRCIHFVDPVLDLPILERVTARLWKERGGGGIGGIAAKRTGGDASPFEVVNALRRRADRKTGLAPWPSRRRRAAVSVADARGGVDTSSAAAAVAAAVRAANAAEAAAAETSDWRAGSFEEEDDEDATETRLASSSSRAAYGRRVSSPPVPSVPESSDAANNVVANNSSRREVERLHALLRDAHVSGTADSGTADSGTALDDAFDASDAFWKAPDEKTRADLGGGGAFEASEDGDFAPSEWIAKVRRSRGRTHSEIADDRGRSRTRSRTIAHDANATNATRREKDASPKQKQKTLPRPLALLATALFLAALGTAAATPTDVKVVVAGTESGVSETGGWVGKTSRKVVVEVGSPTQTQSGIARSRWSEFACAAVAWYAALGFFAEIAIHAAANTTRERR